MKGVFLSYGPEDQRLVGDVRLLALDPSHEVEFYDEPWKFAPDDPSAENVRMRIRGKLARTSVTVCLLNRLTHTSEWVDWELQESQRVGNRIIFMGFKTAPESLTLPKLGRDLAMQWYYWNPQLMMELIGREV